MTSTFSFRRQCSIGFEVRLRSSSCWKEEQLEPSYAPAWGSMESLRRSYHANLEPRVALALRASHVPYAVGKEQIKFAFVTPHNLASQISPRRTLGALLDVQYTQSRARHCNSSNVIHNSCSYVRGLCRFSSFSMVPVTFLFRSQEEIHFAETPKSLAPWSCEVPERDRERDNHCKLEVGRIFSCLFTIVSLRAKRYVLMIQKAPHDSEVHILEWRRPSSIVSVTRTDNKSVGIFYIRCKFAFHSREKAQVNIHCCC